ncbi:MAG: hypothetical protein GSR86_01375 [Desulfurococcales archaeon]|nr:hypothetical protein [Desulfurococcales archaeon]
MRIKIIAADSLGVRSIATVVEACGYTIGIDLGAALGPRRYGLPPHELEYERLIESLNRITKWIENSSIIIITHYHYDHYVRDSPELYYGKTLLVKDPLNNINRSQRVRSYLFLKKSGLEERANIVYADSRELVFEGGLRITFSKPSWHGEAGTKLGKVLMAKIECENETFIYGSDVQGPMDDEALNILLKWIRPGSTVLIDGPPTYFAGYKVSWDSVTKGLRNMLRIIKEGRPSTLIVDHHLVRDLNYRKWIEEHITEAANMDIRLVNAAEYMGLKEEPLEALRKQLWGRDSGS